MKVLLEAPILTNSGYGEHSRLVYESLKEDKNLDIYINPLNWGTCSWSELSEDVLQCVSKYKTYSSFCESQKKEQEYTLQIHVGIPNEFEKKAPYSVCVTAGIETDRVSPEWLLKTHQGIDKLVVTSEHAKSGFVSSGYEIFNKVENTKAQLSCGCPVEVVNYPVKDLSTNELDIDFSTNFNFLQIAMFGTRKNIENSIKCFIEEFRDNSDVGLVLKTSSSKSSIIDRHKTKNSLQNFINSLGSKKCKIYLIHGNLSASQIHSLYNHPKIKAYYMMSHGEGFGLPVFEAAYSGLPVIATDWSGHLDFLFGEYNEKRKKLFIGIDYDLKEVNKESVWDGIITKDSRWAYPKNKSAKNCLSKMYKNYGMYKKWAKILKEILLETHSKKKIYPKMREQIISIIPPDERSAKIHKITNDEVVVFD